MEELLNKLIEKGWKRKGKEKIEKATIRLSESWQVYFGTEEHPYLYADTLRWITSKNSWLWQFCITNHLLKKYSDLWDDWEYIIGRWQDWKDCKTEDWEYIDDNRDSDIYHQDDSYQYRLIESALTDEDKLEDFISQNIKIWNEQN